MFVSTIQTLLQNHDYYKYSYGQLNESSFCVSLVSQYAYAMKTEFPTNIDDKGYLTVSIKTYLTPKPLEPSNIDFEEDGLAFHFVENKAISELPIGTICQVLTEKKDEKGNIYCFVVLKNKETGRNYMNGIEFEQYGWVKKEDLK